MSGHCMSENNHPFLIKHILINRLDHSRNAFRIIRTGKHKTTGGVHAIKQVEHVSRRRAQAKQHGMAGSLLVGEEIVKERFWRLLIPSTIEGQTHANWRAGIGIVPKLHQIVIVTDEHTHMASIAIHTCNTSLIATSSPSQPDTNVHEFPAPRTHGGYRVNSPIPRHTTNAQLAHRHAHPLPAVPCSSDDH